MGNSNGMTSSDLVYTIQIHVKKKGGPTISLILVTTINHGIISTIWHAIM